MLWTDEQSAIGGLMLNTDGTPGVIGFETFFRQYDERFVLWLASFEDDLRTEDIAASTRLEEIAAPLHGLIRTLVEEGLNGSNPEHAGNWRGTAASRAAAQPGELL
jgi:hypothetical protein